MASVVCLLAVRVTMVAMVTVLLFVGSNAGAWETAVKETKIEVDMEKYALELQTSKTESGDRVYIKLYTEQDQRISIFGSGSDIYWYLSSSFGYRLYDCTPHLFMSNVPTVANKIWRVTKTNKLLAVTCNEVEVGKVVFADVDKSEYPECVNRWSRHVAKIAFYSIDDTDMYRTVLLPGCTGLPTELELANVISDAGFPVLYGDKLTVKCKGGYSKQGGDTEITCAGGTTFEYTTKLDCQPDPVSVSAVTVNEGGTVTLSCSYDSGPTVTAKIWYKGGVVVPNETGDDFVKDSVAFTDAGDYACEVTGTTQGTLKSDTAKLTVQGIVTLTQPHITGTYNEVGENISLVGVIRSSAKPTFVSLTVDSKTPDPAITPTIGDADTNGDFSVTFDVPAEKPASGSNALKIILTVALTDTGNYAKPVVIQVYDQCIAKSNGGSLDHQGSLTAGGYTATCNDGAVQLSGADTDATRCVGTNVILVSGMTGGMVVLLMVVALLVLYICVQRRRTARKYVDDGLYTENTITVPPAKGATKAGACIKMSHIVRRDQENTADESSATPSDTRDVTMVAHATSDQENKPGESSTTEPIYCNGELT